MKFDATLERTGAQLKRDAGYDPEAPAANPFGPDESVGGDAGGNHFADNSGYLGDAPGTGNRYKSARYLADSPTTEAAINRMVDESLAVLEDEGDVENEIFRAAYRNFLISAYTEKAGWKAEEVEQAAAEAFSDELDLMQGTSSEVLDMNDPDKAAMNESDSIDRVIESERGFITVQVKTNTDKGVKNSNKDKVDYLLKVDAELDSKEMTVEAKKV